jgi:predicted nucleic acid-binding protein
VLARIGLADLFAKLADEVVIPKAVANEIHDGPEGDLAKHYLDRGYLKVVATPLPTSNLLAWDLGAGETAVLSYCMVNSGWVAVIDDKAARKCARSLAIPIKGTVGVVIMARQKDLIQSAAGTLRELRNNGFWFDDRLVRDALRQTVDESWE